MGCVVGKSKLTKNELEFIARNTDQSLEQVDKQYKNLRQKNPNKPISKWDLRNKNSVHQIASARRVPIIDAMTKSAYCSSARPRNRNIL